MPCQTGLAWFGWACLSSWAVCHACVWMFESRGLSRKTKRHDATSRINMWASHIHKPSYNSSCRGVTTPGSPAPAAYQTVFTVLSQPLWSTPEKQALVRPDNPILFAIVGDRLLSMSCIIIELMRRPKSAATGQQKHNLQIYKSLRFITTHQSGDRLEAGNVEGRYFISTVLALVCLLFFHLLCTNIPLHLTLM